MKQVPVGHVFNKDSGADDVHTSYELSRVHDLLVAADALNFGKDTMSYKTVVWNVLPHSTRMAFNYSRWTYEEK